MDKDEGAYKLDKNCEFQYTYCRYILIAQRTTPAPGDNHKAA